MVAHTMLPFVTFAFLHHVTGFGFDFMSGFSFLMGCYDCIVLGHVQ